MRFKCECGKQTKVFKFDIGGPFRDSCCELAEAAEQKVREKVEEEAAAKDEEDADIAAEIPLPPTIQLPNISQTSFSQDPAPSPEDLDINGDGVVDGEDLKALQADFKAKGLSKAGKVKKKPGPKKKASK